MARELAGRAAARLLPALGIVRLPAHRAAGAAADPAARAGGAAGAGDRRLRAAPRPGLRDRAHRRRDRPARRRRPRPHRRRRRRRGCGIIPGSRSCAGTGRAPTARRSAGRCRQRCRSATAGTCGTASARPSGRRSRRTPPAGPKGTPLQEGKRAADHPRALAAGPRPARARASGLLECARRLGLSLNTVKRYDRASEPERLQRVPKYRPTLVDPYRDHLRKRRGRRARRRRSSSCCARSASCGYQGSSNLLVRYINQGRVEGDRPHLSPRRAARLLLTRPDRLTGGQQETLAAARPPPAPR